MPVKTEKDLPDNLRATWLKAVSAMQLKNYGYVIQLMQPLLKSVPDFLAGRQLLRKAAVARSASKKGLLGGLSTASLSAMKIAAQLKKDPQGALEAIEKILENEPYNQQVNLLLRDAAMAMNLPEVASFAYETILEGEPKDTKILHEYAQHCMATDQPEKAAQIYAKILEINPSDMVAVKGSKDAAARVSIQQGGWEKEDTSYRDLIRDKEQATLLEQTSRVVRSEEMIEQILAELHQQAEAQPQNVDVARRIGELYEQKEDLDNAIQWLEYAFQLGGGADFALARKASDLRLKQYDIAIQQWQDYINSNPGEAEVQSAQAQLETLRQQRLEFELTDAQKRVERNPTDLQARYELGQIYFQLGRAQEAIPELQRARSNPNVRIRACFLLGRCYEAKGMLDMAAKTLAEISAELPSMDSLKKDILYTLGLIYEKMGNKESYLDCLKKIYEVDYGYRDVAPRVEGSY